MSVTGFQPHHMTDGCLGLQRNLPFKNRTEWVSKSCPVADKKHWTSEHENNREFEFAA